KQTEMMTRRVLLMALALLLTGGAGTAYAQEPDRAGAPPRLVNGPEVAEALGSRHPAVLRDQGIGGTARVRLFVNGEGEPDTVRAVASTGLYRLARAIDVAARKARFSPSGTGQPVGWVTLPLSFQGDPAVGTFE